MTSVTNSLTNFKYYKIVMEEYSITGADYSAGPLLKRRETSKNPT